MHFTYSRDTEMKATEFGFDQLGCNNSINYRFVLLADSAIRMLRRFPRSWNMLMVRHERVKKTAADIVNPHSCFSLFIQPCLLSWHLLAIQAWDLWMTVHLASDTAKRGSGLSLRIFGNQTSVTGFLTTSDTYWVNARPRFCRHLHNEWPWRNWGNFQYDSLIQFRLTVNWNKSKYFNRIT